MFLWITGFLGVKPNSMHDDGELLKCPIYGQEELHFFGERADLMYGDRARKGQNSPGRDEDAISLLRTEATVFASDFSHPNYAHLH
jgi:hypothetical protein